MKAAIKETFGGFKPPYVMSAQSKNPVQPKRTDGF